MRMTYKVVWKLASFLSANIQTCAAAFTCHVDSLQLTAFVFNYNETLITKTDGNRGHVAGKIF